MNRSNNITIRISYIIATALLLVLEIVIALFIHDTFIRPYVGDVLVVFLLYTFIRIWLPEKMVTLPLWIFVFSTGVEVLQHFKIVELMGLQDNTFMRVLLGSVFDMKDIICYAAGCTILGMYEWSINKKRNKLK